MQLQAPLILILLLLAACTDDAAFDPFVKTEKVILTSGEQVIVSGRIVADGFIEVMEHGFELSVDPAFSQPIIILLGPRNRPGEFIGSVKNLQLGTNYWVKAFANTAEGFLEGELLPLRTIDLQLANFEPKYGFPGDTLTLIGANFTDDSQVFFGDQEVNTINIRFEYSIDVIVPDGGNPPFIPITVKAKNQTKTYGPLFEYIHGKWLLSGSRPNVDLSSAFNFTIHDSEILIAGHGQSPNDGQPQTNVWLLDKVSHTWTQIDFPGKPLIAAFAAWPYLGGGAYESINLPGPDPLQLSSDFWKWTGNGWVSLPSLPMNRYLSHAFTIDDDLLIFGGLTEFRSHRKAIFKYVEATSNWQMLRQAPFDLDASKPAFKYNHSLYFVNLNDSLFQYDPNAESWQSLGATPTSFNHAVCQVIGDRAYVGVSSAGPQIWEYQIANNCWIRKSNFPTVNFRATVNWEHDGLLHVVGAPNGHTVLDQWQFDPKNIP